MKLYVIFLENDKKEWRIFIYYKIVVWILNKFAGASIAIIADAPYVMNFYLSS